MPKREYYQVGVIWPASIAERPQARRREIFRDVIRSGNLSGTHPAVIALENPLDPPAHKSDPLTAKEALELSERVNPSSMKTLLARCYREIRKGLESDRFRGHVNVRARMLEEPYDDCPNYLALKKELDTQGFSIAKYFGWNGTYTRGVTISIYRYANDGEGPRVLTTEEDRNAGNT